MSRCGRIVSMAVLVALAAACGGGDDDAADPVDASSGASSDEAGDEAEAGRAESGGEPDTQSGGGAGVGAVTLDADPLSAWIEVEGQRHEFRASGTVSFECNVAEDNVRVNLQTASDFFTLNGAVNAGDWIFTLSVDPPGDTNAMYGGSPLTSTGTIGIDDVSMSYEGELDEVVDFDITKARAVPAKFAVNCAGPGGSPSAVIDGVEYSAPFAGARGIRCDVTAEAIDISVQQQAAGFVQITIDATDDGSGWLGSTLVSVDDGSFSSTIPADGTGLVVDGSTVTYEGVFTGPNGDVEGSATITCP